MLDDETRALTSEQKQRADRQERLADETDEPNEEAEHRRRAEKARYLEGKLEDRSQREREQ